MERKDRSLFLDIEELSSLVRASSLSAALAAIREQFQSRSGPNPELVAIMAEQSVFPHLPDNVDGFDIGSGNVIKRPSGETKDKSSRSLTFWSPDQLNIYGKRLNPKHPNFWIQFVPYQRPTELSK